MPSGLPLAPVLLVLGPVLVTLPGPAYGSGHEQDTENPDDNQPDACRYSDAQSEPFPYTNVILRQMSPLCPPIVKNL